MLDSRPNVLWLFLEDTNAWFSCYGDTVIQTPNIDALAASGVKFNRGYQTAGVCSPSRSATITGMYQTTIGAHNHLSSQPNFRGIDMGDEYDAIALPKGMKTIPAYFKDAGYYTFNEGKTDYNFVYKSEELFDHRGDNDFKGAKDGSDWSGCPEGKPFFGQIQLKGGKSIGQLKGPKVDRSSVRVPAFYPDHEIIREEIALHYDCILHTDRQIGWILERLEEDGLRENTIIMLFNDHGMRLPRHKQFIYEGGHKMPLLISWQGHDDVLTTGTERDDLVSSIDIGPTSLALAGLDVPSHMEGQNLFGTDFVERKYVIAAKDRCDFTIDRMRTVRTNRYRYVRNFLTDRPFMQPQYRDGSDFMDLMRTMYANGKLAPEQAFYWAEERPAEEFFDCDADPDEVVNLTNDSNHAEALQAHRDILKQWISATDDKGQYPESKIGLQCVLKRWGNQCVNPEYDSIKS
jgi:N-sulfoglucosamine sulfohydrolase